MLNTGNKFRKSKLSLVCCCAMQTSFAAQAVAVDEAQAVATDEAQAVATDETQEVVAKKNSLAEVITVTATRRVSNLQFLPLSIQAVSGEQLKDLGITRSTDLEKVSPGLNIQAGAFGVSSPQVSIRGVGNNFFNGNAVATVGMYLDEVYLNSSIGHGSHLFDLERIEVLRGPQGTLYGGNATGGALNLISKKPIVGDDIGGNFSADIGSHGETRIEAGVNVPISDNAAMRLSTMSSGLDGYRYNTTLNQDVGGHKSQAFRLQLAYEPTDDLSLAFRLHTADIEADGPQYELRGYVDPELDNDSVFDQFGGAIADFRCSDARALANECAAPGGYQDGVTSPGFYEGAGDLIGSDDVSVGGADLHLDWDIGDVTLTSVTAYIKTERFVREDFDATPVDGQRETWDSNTEQFSQELRLSGYTGGLDWIVGAFYLQEDSEEYKDYVFGEAFGFENGEFTFWQLDTENTAVFTDVTYTISDQLSISGGLRYSNESKDVPTFLRFAFPNEAALGSLDKNLEYGYDLASQLLIGEGTPTEDASGAKDSWSSTTGRLSLSWQADKDTNYYLSFSKGFRSGNINTAEGGGAVFNFVNPEDVFAYELGIKGSILDGRGRLNAAVFFNDYTNIQVSSVLDTGVNQGSIVLLNAGDAETYGAEADFKFQVTDALYTQFGVAFLETEITDALNPELLGNELEQSPGLTFTALAAYTWHLEQGAITAQTDWSYKGEHYMDIFNKDIAKQDAYSTLGARLTYRRDNLSISIFGKNLLEEEYFTNSFGGSNFLGTYYFSTGAPRTYGISFSLDFE